MQSSSLVSLDLFKDLEVAVQLPTVLAKLDEVARESVRSATGDCLCVAYSGGIDSSILATLANQTTESCSLISLGTEGSKDIEEVEQSFRRLKMRIPLFVKKIEKERIKLAAKIVSEMVQVDSISHFEDCVAFYLIAEEVHNLGKCNVIGSANGPDELFCGYDRFRRILQNGTFEDAKEEIGNSLKIADKLRGQVKLITNRFGVRIVEPFLSSKFVKFSHTVPMDLKIAMGDDPLRKRIWRQYGRYLHLPEDVVLKRKSAMQYSMGIHKVILPMVKNQSIDLK
jgi:asparagine synthase (glutamine-hydrolysing)